MPPPSSSFTPLANEAPPRRVALVTGAGKRLGREIALTLAQQGWDVAVHCRLSFREAEATADAVRKLGRDAAVVCADLADESACRHLLPHAALALGQVDAVVNSASTFEYDNAAQFSYASLDKHMRSNVAPAIALAQALAEHMAARKVDGAVVNLLDQKLWNPNPDFLSYTLSKAALESANTLLALALAPRVRVVGVAPGLTLDSQWIEGRKFEDLHRLSPLGRSSTPADVAATVAFALSNRSITGTTLVVDGGQHLQRFERDFSMM